MFCKQGYVYFFDLPIIVQDWNTPFLKSTKFKSSIQTSLLLPWMQKTSILSAVKREKSQTRIWTANFEEIEAWMGKKPVSYCVAVIC